MIAGGIEVESSEIQNVPLLAEYRYPECQIDTTLLGTNISPFKASFEDDFPFPRWDMLVLWRVQIPGTVLRTLF